VPLRQQKLAGIQNVTGGFQPRELSHIGDAAVVLRRFRM
jgi:hypothetical protein